MLQYFTTITKSHLWQTIDTVWKGSCVGVTITVLCVLSAGWSSGTEPTLQNTRAVDSRCQVFREKTRVVLGYTICVLQQYNEIYKHVSSLLGINVFCWGFYRVQYFPVHLYHRWLWVLKLERYLATIQLASELACTGLPHCGCSAQYTTSLASTSLAF